MTIADAVRFVATAPRRWVKATLVFGLLSAVLGAQSITANASLSGFAPWLALWLGSAATLVALVGLFTSRRPDLSVSFETAEMHWRDGRGDTRIAYKHIEAVSFSRGKGVPSAFYLSARDGRRLALDCRQLSFSAFDNMRWELEARTGLEVKREGALWPL
jgi:hypothetical protein